MDRNTTFHHLNLRESHYENQTCFSCHVSYRTLIMDWNPLYLFTVSSWRQWGRSFGGSRESTDIRMAHRGRVRTSSGPAGAKSPVTIYPSSETVITKTRVSEKSRRSRGRWAYRSKRGLEIFPKTNPKARTASPLYCVRGVS